MANRKNGKIQFEKPLHVDLCGKIRMQEPIRTICRMEEINLLKQLVELLSSKYQIVARIRDTINRLRFRTFIYTHTHARAKSIQALVRVVRGNNHMQIM